MTTLTELRSPWLVAPAVLLAALLIGRIVVAALRPILRRAARRTAWEWDDRFVEVLATPASFLIALQLVRTSSPWWPIDPRGIPIIMSGSAIATSLLVMWLAFRLIDLFVQVLGTQPWAATRPASRSLLAIAGRVGKVLLIALAGIILLSQLGVSVASLIAGLGIGGLALALAAQKTVENLFGTMSIAVDQPLREGDFVRVGEHVGTVEAIGLRSTRVRTLDRTVVTIPNGMLADERIESYSARDRMRLNCTLGLEYGTTAAQVRTVVELLGRALADHPKIWPDKIVVWFTGFGESTLDIEVMAWFITQDWNEFQSIRQDVLLTFMEIVEANSTGFAFPTRKLILSSPS